MTVSIAPHDHKVLKLKEERKSCSFNSLELSSGASGLKGTIKSSTKRRSSMIVSYFSLFCSSNLVLWLKRNNKIFNDEESCTMVS